MIPISVTAQNLVQGPATLYIGEFQATEPADSAVGSTPSASAWTDIGGTMGGTEIAIQQEFKELEVDQLVDVPGRRLVKRDTSVKTQMAEPTLENLVLAMNDDTDNITDGGTANFQTFEPSDSSSATQPNYKALLVDGYAPYETTSTSNRGRLIVRKVLATDNVEFAYKKEDQTVFTVTWSAHYVSSAIKPFKLIYQRG